jgi:hypothetical protein
MKRTPLLAALVLPAALGLAASDAFAQLVPLSQCGAAIPCSIPTGLRPADAAALSPYGRVGNGNTLMTVSAQVDEAIRPRLITRGVAEDASERAARLFVKRNPGLLRAPTPTPTPPR